MGWGKTPEGMETMSAPGRANNLEVLFQAKVEIKGSVGLADTLPDTSLCIEKCDQ